MSERYGDIGPCCVCGEPAGYEGNPVTFWMLPVQNPDDVPNGWGCIVCSLAAKGASAILCDRCANRAEKELGADWKRLTSYCAGENSRARRPIAELLGRPLWAHDMSKHPPEDVRKSTEDDW